MFATFATFATGSQLNNQRDWIGLREFARRCGRAHRAAQQAIADGRIPASAVRHDAGGRIIAVDYHQASACWEQNTDQVRANFRPFTPAPAPARSRAPAQRAPVQTSARDAVLEQLGEVLGTVFCSTLIAAAAMSVWRHGLRPAQALDVHEDTLLVVMYAAADALQLDTNR